MAWRRSGPDKVLSNGRNVDCNHRNGLEKVTDIKRFNGATTDSNCNEINHSLKVAAPTSQNRYNSDSEGLPFPELPPIVSYTIIALCAIFSFWGSLGGGFVFDDTEAVVNNDDVNPDTPLLNMFQNDFWGTKLTHKASHKSYRPLTILSFRLNALLSGGLHPLSFHATNLLLHVAVCLLSCRVFIRLLGGQARSAGLLCAIIFTVHPVHSEAVSAVVGRADLLCALFFFTSLLCYVRCIQSWEESLVSGGAWLIVTVVSCGIAMLCKEQGITVLGMCSAYDIIVAHKLDVTYFLVHCTAVKSEPTKPVSPVREQETGRVLRMLRVLQAACQRYKAVILRHFFLAGCGFVMLMCRYQVMGSPPAFQEVDNPASFHSNVLIRVLNYQYVYFLNLLILIWPRWLCFDWSMGCVPLIDSLFDWRVCLVFVLWTIAGLLFVRCLYSENKLMSRQILISVAMLVIPFLPASNLFFRVGFVLAERVLYLSVGGLAMLFVLGMKQFYKVYRHPAIIQFMYLLLVLIFSIRSAQRCLEWQTEETLFQSGLDVCPLNAKVHYNIAKNAADAGHQELAIMEYREALRLNIDYDQAMNNLANILKDDGQLEEAEELLQRAVEIRPDFAAAWMNLGIVRSSLKKYEDAEESYLRALMHRRRYPDCYYNLGNLYLDQKKHHLALLAWRNATEQKPTHSIAWTNMVILLDSIGELEQAEAVANEALAVLPNEPPLHFNLANVLGKLGRYHESERHFINAIKILGNNPTYYANLGVLYHRWKKFDKAERAYRHALQLNPDLRSAQDNLDMLTKSRSKSRKR